MSSFNSFQSFQSSPTSPTSPTSPNFNAKRINGTLKDVLLKRNNVIVLVAMFTLITSSIFSISLQQSQQGEPTYVMVNESINETFKGTYNETRANNVLIDPLGFRLNFINGTNNPVKLIDTIQGVNITISDTTGGSGGLTGLGSLNQVAVWTNSTNLDGFDTLLFDPVTYQLFIGNGTANIADKGTVNLPNNSRICWEVNPDDGDKCIKLNASNNWIIESADNVDIDSNDLKNFKFLISNDIDPADSGSLRLGNNRSICWEANPTGSDVCITVNGSNFIDVSSHPIINFSSIRDDNGNPSDSGQIRLSNGVTGVCWEGFTGSDVCITVNTSDDVTFGTNANFIDLNGNPLVVNVAGDPSDSGNIRLENTNMMCWESAPAGADNCLQVDANENLLYDSDTVSTGEVFSGAVYELITKTNINTAFVDIYTGTGQNSFPTIVNCEGHTQVRAFWHWNKNAGAGTHDVRLADQANNSNVLISSTNIPTGMTDTGWVSIPAFCTGEFVMEWQGKASNATDDPIAVGYSVYLR